MSFTQAIARAAGARIASRFNPVAISLPRSAASQPDALGVPTRLAAARMHEAGIVLKPLLRSAGLSASQINRKDMRIGVASQIRFLELAAKALNDPVLGFRLARDGESLRLAGLLHYVAASSETLGIALDRTQRFCSITNAGLVLQCVEACNLTIALRYASVARHSDRQQMEYFVTWLIRFCRESTDRRLNPNAVQFVHRRTLLFDRQCGPRSPMRRILQFNDCLALCQRRQTFRSATDGIFCDMTYPLLQGINRSPSEPERRPVRSSPNAIVRSPMRASFSNASNPAI